MSTVLHPQLPALGTPLAISAVHCVWIGIDLCGACDQLAVDIIGVLVVTFFQPFELVYNHGGYIGKELGAISFGKEMQHAVIGGGSNDAGTVIVSIMEFSEALK